MERRDTLIVWLLVVQTILMLVMGFAVALVSYGAGRSAAEASQRIDAIDARLSSFVDNQIEWLAKNTAKHSDHSYDLRVLTILLKRMCLRQGISIDAEIKYPSDD